VGGVGAGEVEDEVEAEVGGVEEGEEEEEMEAELQVPVLSEPLLGTRTRGRVLQVVSMLCPLTGVAWLEVGTR
jgi:hypothetical protein